MKAAVVTSFGSPPEIQERDIPQPSADRVLVRMEACGLCHTDEFARTERDRGSQDNPSIVDFGGMMSWAVDISNEQAPSRNEPRP